MSAVRPVLAGAAWLLMSACHQASSEAPPLEDKLEIASAAPGALGALAAGTDAAPPPPARQPRKTWAVPGDVEEEEELADPEELDGGSTDSGPLEPPAQDVPL